MLFLFLCGVFILTLPGQLDNGKIRLKWKNIIVIVE